MAYKFNPLANLGFETSLGYTPANKAGDTFSGSVSINTTGSHFNLYETDAADPADRALIELNSNNLNLYGYDDSASAFRLFMSGNVTTGNVTTNGAWNFSGVVTASNGSGVSAGGSNVSFYLTNTGTGGGSYRWVVGQTGDVLPGGIGLFDNTAGAYRFAIGSSGQIGIGGANYGTSGQVLTSQGASAAPVWATPAGGGAGWELLQSVIASNSATVTLNAFSATYDNYVIVVDGCRPVTDSTNLIMRFNTRTSAYLWVYQSIQSNSTSETIVQDGSQSTSGFVIAPALNNNAVACMSSVIEVMSSRTSMAIASWRSNYPMPTIMQNRHIIGGGNNQDIVNVSQVVFLMSSGNISAGNFRLYGIKKA